MVGETMYLYLAISAEAVNDVLVKEEGTNQTPNYFFLKALVGPESRYQKIEKVALARKLRRYFLAHSIVVRTDQPLKNVLFRPNLAGRMTKWSIELKILHNLQGKESTEGSNVCRLLRGIHSAHH